jgi:hypothetical protein
MPPNPHFLPKYISSGLANNIKTTFTPTGNFEEDKAKVEAYAKAVGMDEANTKLGIVLATEGNEAFIKKAFENPNDPTKQLSYAEMRARYG